MSNASYVYDLLNFLNIGATYLYFLTISPIIMVLVLALWRAA
ncbi:hypothetical protein BDE36_3424 [Arcticibacter tournemirensis]|nr:hypothetical protein BDE36_3424 [Arcticibacter tournemirensis]